MARIKHLVSADVGDQGCVYIKEAYICYWTSCVKGVHTGQMVLKVVEAIGEAFCSLIDPTISEIY